MESKKLLQVKVSDSCIRQLEEIKNASGLSTISDVIRLSIVLFRWVVEKQENGYDIYAVPNPKRKEGSEAQAEKINLLIPI